MVAREEKAKSSVHRRLMRFPDAGPNFHFAPQICGHARAAGNRQPALKHSFPFISVGPADSASCPRPTGSMLVSGDWSTLDGLAFAIGRGDGGALTDIRMLGAKDVEAGLARERLGEVGRHGTLLARTKPLVHMRICRNQSLTESPL